jgi:hypothetical protein
VRPVDLLCDGGKEPRCENRGDFCGLMGKRVVVASKRGNACGPSAVSPPCGLPEFVGCCIVEEIVGPSASFRVKDGAESFRCKGSFFRRGRLDCCKGG